LSRYGLEHHYTVRSFGWNSPGFFVGDIKRCDDLVAYWNLRASDIPLWFVDPNYINRYSNILPAWEAHARAIVSRRTHEFERQIGVWYRCDKVEDTQTAMEAALKPFEGKPLTACGVSPHLWNGRNLLPPMMYLDEVAALGVLGGDNTQRRLSFSLPDKPFSSDAWFHTQHLVASVSFLGGIYDDGLTLCPPFIPELNEFYARTIHFDYSKLRIESERVGLVIDAADKDAFVHPLPVADLFDKIFDSAGFTARPSKGGLILRQLIRQLGGLHGARVFKIPGVRRLLKVHGPTDTFKRNEALQLIGSRDPQHPDESSFNDHQNIYIQPRAHDRKLEAQDVFAYLVEKGLFRIGKTVNCPSCRMSEWISLDALKHKIRCEMCGYEYEVTGQLIDDRWDYRRSGLLGAERNAQGAVSVALTLQQLETNLHSFHQHIYSTSLDLTPKHDRNLPKCEVDFIWMIPRPYPRKTVVIFGECKDRGPVKLVEFQKDVDNLRKVADALPRRRFKTFFLLAKLASFTDEEINLVQTLNDEHRLRAILLTPRELEPYHIYERVEGQLTGNNHGGTPEDLAEGTAQLYFNKKRTASVD
jgi:hypothetical protein